MNPDQPPEGQAKPAAAAEAEPQRVLLHMPVDIRSMALVVLAVVAVLAVLRGASGFFIPVMIGLMFSYALSPVVNWFEKIRIPRAISAAVLILGILGGAGASVYSFSDDASQLVNSLPEGARKLRDVIRERSGKAETPLGTVQKAATQLEQAAEEAGAATPAGRGVQRVVIEKARFNIRDHLWSGTMGLVSLMGQVIVVTFLTYFLLLSGDTFRRKVVKIAGPSLSSKKITVQALDEITLQIQRYLLVQLVSSIAVGLVTGLAFWALGLNHVAVWAIAAAILNLVPYIGSAVVAGAAAMAGFVQFGNDQHGPRGGRGLARHPHHLGQPDRALAHQQGQQHERRGGVRLRAGLGLAVGLVGTAAGHPHHDGGQGRLRPRRRPQAGGRTARQLTRLQPVLRSAAAMPLIEMWMPRRARSSSLPDR